MASALAIVALAGWLQMVTVGESPSHTESPAAAWWEHAHQDQESLCGTAALDTGGWCNGSTADAVQAAGVRFPQSDQNEASLHAYLGPSQFESGPQEPSLLDLYLIPTLREIRTVAPEPVATVAAASAGQLSEEQAIDVLQAAGWPTELIPQALAVAWCESKWSPGASGDSGRSRGWFQLNVATWFPYAGEDPEQWADALVNARVAWATYNYDLSRGQRAWQQWSCRSAVY